MVITQYHAILGPWDLGLEDCSEIKQSYMKIYLPVIVQQAAPISCKLWGIQQHYTSILIEINGLFM